MDLLRMEREQAAREMKMTILHRPYGIWLPSEISCLTNQLMTELHLHPEHPAYILICGHYTMDKIKKVLPNATSFMAKQIVGLDSKDLPFKPRL